MSRPPRNQVRTVGELETVLRHVPRETKILVRRSDGKTIPVIAITTDYQIGSGQLVINLKTEN